MTNFEKVKEFHHTFGVPSGNRAHFYDRDVQKLRLRLIREELRELEDAMTVGNEVETADALTDLLYVVYGAGVTWDINLDQCFTEVHRSNMSKLGADGPIHRKDGKVMKGPNYSPPNLLPIVATLITEEQAKTAVFQEAGEEII